MSLRAQKSSLTCSPEHVGQMATANPARLWEVSHGQERAHDVPQPANDRTTQDVALLHFHFHRKSYIERAMLCSVKLFRGKLSEVESAAGWLPTVIE